MAACCSVEGRHGAGAVDIYDVDVYSLEMSNISFC